MDFLNRFALGGIVLLGSTGEFTHFDVADRIKLVQMAVKRSRKPVMVNVSHTAPETVGLLATEALEAGARGAFVMPPYYFRYDAESLRLFFRCVHGLAAGAGPLLLYNIPFFTTPLGADLAQELLAEGYAGIKDSSGDPLYLRDLNQASHRGDFRLFIGNDSMFVRGLAGGADGVVSGVAQMAPELMLALHAAVTANDPPRLAALSALLDDCLAWLDRYPVPLAIRAIAAERGLPAGAFAAVPDLQPLREWFRQWHPRVLAAVAA